MEPLHDVDPGGVPLLARQGWVVWRDAVRTWSLRNLLVAVVAALLLAAAAAWLVLSRSPQYYSQATLLIDNPAAIATAHDDAPILKLNVLRLKYASLAATPAILAPAAQASGLPLSDLQRAATFPSPAALVLTVAARTGSAALSQKVANAVADEIPVYVQHEHDQYNVPAPDRFIFTVVGHAFPGRKISPSWSRARTTAAGAGIAGLAVGYLVLQLATGPRRLVTGVRRLR